MIDDVEWLGFELNQDAAYVAWLQINDPDRIDGYLRDCNYTERLELWKKARA